MGYNLSPEESEDTIDLAMYHATIGSLTYLTASCPDVMFVVYLCAMYQLSPRVTHLVGVKRIFHYTKDNNFELITYKDSDYGGCMINFN